MPEVRSSPCDFSAISAKRPKRTRTGRGWRGLYGRQPLPSIEQQFPQPKHHLTGATGILWGSYLYERQAVGAALFPAKGLGGDLRLLKAARLILTGSLGARAGCNVTLARRHRRQRAERCKVSLMAAARPVRQAAAVDDSAGDDR